MKQFLDWALPTLLAASSACAAVTSLPTSVDHTKTLPFIPNQFIVEFDYEPRASSRRSLERVSHWEVALSGWPSDYSQRHDALYSTLRKRQIAFNVDIEYDQPGLFSGVALTIEVCRKAQSVKLVLT